MTDSVHLTAEVQALDPNADEPQAKVGSGNIRANERAWRPRGHDFDALRHQEVLLTIFDDIRRAERWDSDALQRILARRPRNGKVAGGSGIVETGYFSKIELIKGYQQLTAARRLAVRARRAAPAADEADPHIVRCRTGDGVDGAGGLPWALHLLPGRGRDAQELSAQRAGRAARGAVRL